MRKVKKLFYAAFMLWLCVVALSLCVSCNKPNPNNKTLKQYRPADYVEVLTDFNIFYKDGNVSKCKATSVIYGTADDNIYFLGQYHDTLQVVPKVMVEDVEEVTYKIKK